MVPDSSETAGQSWPSRHRFVRGNDDTRRTYKGVLCTFDYTGDALVEIGRFFRTSGKVIVPFTVREILDEQIAHKLA